MNPEIKQFLADRVGNNYPAAKSSHGPSCGTAAGWGRRWQNIIIPFCSSARATKFAASETRSSRKQGRRLSVAAPAAGVPPLPCVLRQVC